MKIFDGIGWRAWAAGGGEGRARTDFRGFLDLAEMGRTWDRVDTTVHFVEFFKMSFIGIVSILIGLLWYQYFPINLARNFGNQVDVNSIGSRVARIVGTTLGVGGGAVTLVSSLVRLTG